MEWVFLEKKTNKLERQKKDIYILTYSKLYRKCSMLLSKRSILSRKKKRKRRIIGPYVHIMDTHTHTHIYKYVCVYLVKQCM